ncbi:MAG: asparagine synthase C-terminal domain-containing protein [Candidatus Woesearchaeota archaeon]
MKQEFFIKNNEIISESDWIQKINSFKIDSEEEVNYSEDKISLEVKRLLDNSIKERIEGLDNVGICFSGGLDSSYIAAVCKRLKANFTCYTIGFQDGHYRNPEDITYAKEVAKHLKLTDDEFQYKIFSFKEIESIIRQTSKILQKVNVNTVVNVGVGAVEVAAYSISNKEKVFFSGLGSEEIFAGYERHKLNPSNDECYNGLLQMYNRDLIRDTALPKALKFSFTTPFLDENLIRYAMKIPIKYKINSSGSKMILRKSSEAYLGKYSKRPKKAAQYGSNTDKAIERFAHKGLFKTKKEYLDSI